MDAQTAAGRTGGRLAAIGADRVVVLAVAAVVGWWCLRLVDRGLPGRSLVDLQVYRMGGAGVGHGDLYSLALPSNGLPYTYPPFAAALTAPLAQVPLGALVVLWTAAGVLCLAFVVGRVLAVTGVPPRRRGTVVPVVVVLSLALEPVWSTLSFGQVNLFLLALVVGDALRPVGASQRWAGVGIGIAAGIKLTPLIFIPYLVLTGRLRAAAMATAAFAGTVAIGFAVDPRSATDYWTGVMWDADRVGGVAYAGNQSTLGVLTRWGGGEPASWVWLLVAGTLSGAALLLGVLLHRRGEPALGLCLAATAMLLASPISWDHHWVWCVPTALALLSALRHRDRAVRIGAIASWVAVFASACVWWGPESGGVELRWTLAQQVPGNGYFLAALGLLGVVLFAALPRGRRTTPADERRGRPLVRARGAAPSSAVPDQDRSRVTPG
ncbi:glycosyltransferase 87 family protein [Nocardioides sp.]|uniref:glycosyltransferase 87 family protein n=1 Tax=Nocardioides sp. TaxID=35761 RepID=UPI0035196D81